MLKYLTIVGIVQIIQALFWGICMQFPIAHLDKLNSQNSVIEMNIIKGTASAGERILYFTITIFGALICPLYWVVSWIAGLVIFLFIR